MSAIAALLIACTGKTTDSSSNQPTAEPDAPADTGTTLPSQPETFTLVVSGDTNISLSFDAPTCTITDGVPNFYAYWRDSSGTHKFVLKAELRGIYAGEGLYTSADGAIVKLQEEAGGEARFFQTTTDLPNDPWVEIEGVVDDTVWGTGNASNLSGPNGSISLTPTTFPIWCSEENTN